MTAREVDVLREALERRLGDSSVPTLPEVAIKIIELVTDPSKGMRDFARVIETDHALTGRLLRMVNSAMYAQRTPVTQLNRAMVLLGIDRLKAVVLGFHLSQATISDEGDFSTRRVWTQSIFRAWLAFHLCERLDRSLTGEAFVVGLMLDAATPLMPRLVGEDYFRHVRSAAAPQDQFKDETDKLQFTHVDLAHALCRLWRLPDTLSRPIVAHHTRPDGFSKQNSFSVLHAIAYYAGALRLTEREEGEAVPESPCAGLAKQLLGIEQPELRECLSRAARDFAASKAIFSHVMDPSMTVERILQTVNQELNETVESLVTESLAGDGTAGAVRFQIQSLILEMEPTSQGRVKVFLADESGQRVFSEDLEPGPGGGSELRSMLLHHNADERQISEVMDQFTRLAA
jgi:HD-like signal output (HDOD) protein